MANWPEKMVLSTECCRKFLELKRLKKKYLFNDVYMLKKLREKKNFLPDYFMIWSDGSCVVSFL